MGRWKWKNTYKYNLNILVLFAIISLFLSACNTAPTVVRGPPPQPVNLPFLRLEQAGECYYIDDFLPTPDSLVNGKTSNLYLRYYTYWNARYKYWSEVGIMLAFYSRDMRCWALFEEYALPRIDDIK
ncbi:hypothetical protein [Fluviispira multicolorata]|uniref:Lipoprotein n=1 Tax=Fluviispira multicolorata TaxID=2654512 RepID=A0A833JCS6_9BACT|nr:hypothetical protein [Fluviispira multicolorata]KAB8027738.1 hypothetical protein GCL57_14100 [Fluviispira multicolorata]